MIYSKKSKTTAIGSLGMFGVVFLSIAASSGVYAKIFDIKKHRILIDEVNNKSLNPSAVKVEKRDTFSNAFQSYKNLPMQPTGVISVQLSENSTQDTEYLISNQLSNIPGTSQYQVRVSHRTGLRYQVEILDTNGKLVTSKSLLRQLSSLLAGSNQVSVIRLERKMIDQTLF